MDKEPTPLAIALDRIDRARRRFIWSVLALVVGTGTGWALSGQLYELLASPLTTALVVRGLDERLVFTRLTDPFVLYFTVALITGIILATPVLMAQLWLVATPLIGRWRALSVILFSLTAMLLFTAGLTFCHMILLPFAVGYLLDMGDAFAHAITVRDYLKFAVRLLLAMGLAAQLPLASFTAARLRLVSARLLWKWFPYTVLVIFVVAAWVTPPDGMSQLLVAVPLLILYVIGIGVAAVARPR